jgi:hypothetical protein
MKKSLSLLWLSIIVLAGCINNDLPYPVVVPNITSLTVQDAVDVDIDYDARKVTVYVSETTDLTHVVVQSVEFDSSLTRSSVILTGVHDLTSPMKFTLSTYQEYEWTLTAVRPIERYFTVLGQVGSSVIDEYNKRVMAAVSEGTDISNLTVTSFKLGPKDITTYSLAPEQMTDFTDGIEVDVTAFGVTQTWSLYVEETDISVEISKVNPWTKSAYVTATAVAGRQTRFMYRQAGDSDWIEVNPDAVISDGGTFVAYIRDLMPATSYEVIVRSDQDETPVWEFETAPATRIPNGSFEYASYVTGTNYYKFYDPYCGVADGQTMFWGSGNGEGPEGVNGSANMGIIITTIDKEDKVDGKQSVCAQTSQLAGILAAGNLFTGQFAGLVGTEGGKVNFGRPWTTRPVAMKLCCRYVTGNIDIIGKKMPPGVNITKSDYDRAQIKFALGTWNYKTYGGTKESPVHINTTDAGTFVDFTKDPGTIAYGDLILHKDGYILNRSEKVDSQTWEWAEYTIPLEYYDIDTLPTHIIVSCASSQYGDYFTGCSSSKLWIDKVELVY